MKEELQRFWSEVANIQSNTVDIMLCKSSQYPSLEGLLKDATYEIIYRLMEMCDGYLTDDIQYRIQNVKTGAVVNQGIDLHNDCEIKLQCTDI